MSKLNLINPQWQGGADIAVLAGTCEIETLYLAQAPFTCVPVSESAALEAEQGILGYRVIQSQTLAALDILRGSGAERVFTVGGSCDADAAAILYMNELCRGDLAVLWLDAHGDLNAPEESATHLFYGMPVRMLLGGCGAAFAEIVPKPMAPRQFIHLGVRDLEAAESRFMRLHRMELIPARGVADLPGAIHEALKRSGKQHLYIHLDLDVLEPSDFPYTPVPVEAGLALGALLPLLATLRQSTDIIGFGIFEYIPAGVRTGVMEQLVRFGLDL